MSKHAKAYKHGEQLPDMLVPLKRGKHSKTPYKPRRSDPPILCLYNECAARVAAQTDPGLRAWRGSLVDEFCELHIKIKWCMR